MRLLWSGLMAAGLLLVGMSVYESRRDRAAWVAEARGRHRVRGRHRLPAARSPPPPTPR